MTYGGEVGMDTAAALGKIKLTSYCYCCFSDD